MTSINRFRKVAQSLVEENKEILTLPKGSGEKPEITVEEPAGNLQTDQSQIQFPTVEWNFFTESDPTTFNDDVVSLIEHLANLQVSMDVLQKATELINENQQPEMNQPVNEEATVELDAPPAEPAPEQKTQQPQI